MMITKIFSTVALGAMLLSACAEMGASTAGTSGAPPGGAAPNGDISVPAGAGASLGLKDELIVVALQAAKSYLGGKMGGGAGAGAAPNGAPPGGAPPGGSATQDVTQGVAKKEEAAKVGVQAAADKAKQQGQELSQPQQTGLMELVKNLL